MFFRRKDRCDRAAFVSKDGRMTELTFDPPISQSKALYAVVRAAAKRG